MGGAHFDETMAKEKLPPHQRAENQVAGVIPSPNRQQPLDEMAAMEGRSVLPEVLYRLRAMTDKLPFFFYRFTIDSQGKMSFPYASAGFARLFRLNPDTLKATAAEVFAVLHPDDSERIHTSIRHSAAHLSPWQQDFRVSFADGEERRLYAHSIPTRQAGASVSWDGFIADITTLGDGANQYRNQPSKEPLNEHIIEDFLAMLAQEFRTPLSLLASSTEIINRYGSRLPDAQLDEQHKTISLATRKIAELFDSIFAYCHLNYDHSSNLPVMVDFSAICEDVAEGFREEYGDQYCFLVAIAPDCGSMLLDEKLLRRLLHNLLANAFRFTPPGGTVSLLGKRESDHLLVEVSDTGIGIPHEDQQRVFAPFCHAGNTDGRHGIGLGLPIAQTVLKQMGGTLNLASRPGEGTAIRFEIPIVTATTHQAPGQYSILIVEDDPFLCKNMGLILQMEGFSVRTALDGATAVSIAREQKPDLILCDILMPGMNGHTVLEHLKNDENLADILFIFVTALSDNAEIRRGMLAGADDYLTKPFSTEDLLSSVRGRLDKLAAQRKRMGSTGHSVEEGIIRSRISKREREVLILVGHGLTTKEIADKLFISPKTVDVHRSRLMKKLNAINAVVLARWADIAERMVDD